MVSSWYDGGKHDMSEIEAKSKNGMPGGRAQFKLGPRKQIA